MVELKDKILNVLRRNRHDHGSRWERVPVDRLPNVFIDYDTCEVLQAVYELAVSGELEYCTKNMDGEMVPAVKLAHFDYVAAEYISPYEVTLQSANEL